jgi:hypothetical protein
MVLACFIEGGSRTVESLKGEKILPKKKLDNGN